MTQSNTDDSTTSTLSFDMHSESRGAIELFLGSMFAGKSSELLRRLRRYYLARKKTIVIKYAKDTRYTKKDIVQTHDGMQQRGVATLRLDDISTELLEHMDVIGIDEGQFFDDIVEFCETWANAGKIVIVAALDGDYKRQPFKRILNLVPLAERVIKLSAVCIQCGHKASFTKLLNMQNNEQKMDKSNILIGGEEKYRAVCRECYFNVK